MENGYVSALQAKHNALQTKINAEMSRPLPNTVLLAALKKQKLKLKEELHSA